MQSISYSGADAAHVRRKNFTALSVTVGLHLLILLLLILWKYSPSIPAPTQELGMEVNLGTSDEGMGDDQPEEPGMPARVAAVAATPPTTDDGVQTDDNAEADAPAVKPKPKPNTQRPTPNVQRPTPATTPITAPPAPKPKYTYDGSDGPGGNGALNTRPGSGEGNTGKPGDRGVPGGTPGAGNYTGTPGPGTSGIGHTLGNRNIVVYPPKEAQFRAGGKVVVRVTVNRAGNIVASRVISAPNNELRAIALQKVSSVRFSKSDDAPVEQFGDITINFKSR